jgi:large repetitive protein
MRITRVIVVFAALAAIATPVAMALAFDDYVKPPNGIEGTAYDFQFKARTGCDPDYFYSLYRGSLPPGLTLSQSGRITGIPTTPGSYTFTVLLESYRFGCTSYPSQRDFTIEIAPKLTVTTDNIGFGIVGAPYSIKFAATGGGEQTWSIYSGQLPPGLSFAPDGTLAGTPTTVGAYSFVVRVADASRSDTHQISIEVVEKLTAAPVATKPAEVGAPISVKLGVTGGKGPFAWTQTGGTFPAGVALAGDTISGVPTAAGSFVVQLTATDALQETATVDVSLTVSSKIAIKTLRLPLTKVGKHYQATLRTVGGVGPFTWRATAGKFPVGIRLDRKTGVVSGTARKAGTYSITFMVKDALGETSEVTLTLTVNAAKKKK